MCCCQLSSISETWFTVSLLAVWSILQAKLQATANTARAILLKLNHLSFCIHITASVTLQLVQLPVNHGQDSPQEPYTWSGAALQYLHRSHRWFIAQTCFIFSVLFSRNPVQERSVPVLKHSLS